MEIGKDTVVRSDVWVASLMCYASSALLWERIPVVNLPNIAFTTLHAKTYTHKIPVQRSTFRKCTKHMWNIPVIYYRVGGRFWVLLSCSSVNVFGALYVARIQWLIMVKAPASSRFAQLWEKFWDSYSKKHGDCMIQLLSSIQMQHIFPFHRYQIVIRNIQSCILVHVWVARETKVATKTRGDCRTFSSSSSKCSIYRL